MKFSLQTRFYFFLLLPVTLILLGSGYASLQYARSTVQEQWKSVIQHRLEQTAHQIQMRLNEKLELMDLIAGAEDIPNGGVTRTYLIQRLNLLPGVRIVDIQPLSEEEYRSPSKGCWEAAQPEGFGECVCLEYQNERWVYSSAKPAGPRTGPMSPCDPSLKTVHATHQTVHVTPGFLSLAKRFVSSSDSTAKRLVVTVRFDSFLAHVLEIGQWADSSARLVTRDGVCLARTDSDAEATGKSGVSRRMLERSLLREIKTKESGILLGEGRRPETVVGFHRIPSTDWYLVLFAKGGQLFAPVAGFCFNYLLAGLATMALVALLIRWSTWQALRQISAVSEAASKVVAGDLTTRVAITGSDEIADLQKRFNLMIENLERKDLVEQTFGRYVDRKVAAYLMDEPESLSMGGKTQVVTILMADLRGFTLATEKMSPEKVIKILNRHFSRMIAVIAKFSGIIVDFYGDGVLAFFNGSGSDVASRAADAVMCALEMQREIDVLVQENLREGLPALRMGIGIHTDEVVVGNIGSEERAKYGIVGSAVNETDRIQSVAQGGTIMISRQAYELISDKLVIEGKRRVDLKGLTGVRDLYLVVGMDEACHSVAGTAEQNSL